MASSTMIRSPSFRLSTTQSHADASGPAASAAATSRGSRSSRNRQQEATAAAASTRGAAASSRSPAEAGCVCRLGSRRASRCQTHELCPGGEQHGAQWHHRHDDGPGWFAGHQH